MLYSNTGHNHLIGFSIFGSGCLISAFGIDEVVFPILQVPVKSALGSIESLLVIISPEIFAVAFKESSSETFIFPSIFPEISEFLQLISPITAPVGPIITFPFVVKLPLRFPSMRISLSQRTSPLMVVPVPIRLIEFDTTGSSIYAIAVMF